ncbi:MAG: FHA domain-containing protein, partial [Cyanobacteria bacterium J06641_2]
MTQTGNTTVLDNPYLELNHQGQILRLPLIDQEHKFGRDASFADLLVPRDWQVVGRSQAVLFREGDNYRIYDGDGSQPSTNGLYINRTRITPDSGFLLTNGTEIQIGQNPENQVLLKYNNPKQPVKTSEVKLHSVSLKSGSVLMGRDETANLTLDAPTVSRRHAIIDKDTQGRYIIRDTSTNGVFVDGEKISGSKVLSDNSTIRIGPYTLLLSGSELKILDRGNKIRLDACNLVIVTKGKRRLDGISCAIEPGQLVALVGGSGAGKSTLMRSLLGTEKLTEGVVYLNGEDLRNTFNIYRTQIGYVPQDDIIHRQLTVAQVLTYAAKLRLPPDIDVQKVVEQTLSDVEMSHRRHA